MRKKIITLAIISTLSSVVMAGNTYQIDIGLLKKVNESQVFDFNTPLLSHKQFLLDHKTKTINGVTFYEGYLKSDISKRFYIKETPDGLTGKIQTENETYIIGFANNVSYLTIEGTNKKYNYAENKNPTLIYSDKTMLSSDGISQKLKLDINSLTQLPENSETSLNINGKTINLVHDVKEVGEHGVNWLGYIKENGTDFRAVLTYGQNGEVFGSINTPDNTYLLDTFNGETLLIDTQQRGIVPHIELDDYLHPHIGSAEPKTTKETKVITASGTTTPQTATTNVSNVDLLFLYSSLFAQKYGAGLNTKIQNMLATTQQSYTDSKIHLKLNIVARKEIPVTTEAENNNKTISRLLMDKGEFEGVSKLRTSVGADLVTYVRNFDRAQVSCGVAYVGGSGGNDIKYYSNYTYSVFGEGRQNGLYCQTMTWAHELGHNMGSMHDRATVAKQGGGIGAYPYSFGYGIAGKFGTVMSYIQPRLGKFSSPLDTSCNNNVCGVAETNTTQSADNVKSLNNTRLVVQNFRAAPTTDTAVSFGGVITTSTKAPLPDVAVSLITTSVGTTTIAPKCTRTNNAGLFTCKVSSKWTGYIAPSSTVYLFTPSSKAATASGDAGKSFSFVATKK